METKFMCGFDQAWIGKCKEPVNCDGDRCEKHADLVCVSCGAMATHTCHETMGLVCGAPLCDDCEHTIFPDGTNGGFSQLPEGMSRHCRKSEQKYIPWYAREEVTHKTVGES